MVTRRDFLKSSAFLGIGSILQGLFPVLSYGEAGPNDTRVLFINLNGGLDGLAALQPIAGNAYSTLAAMRPTTSGTPGSLLAADGRFSFHANLGLFKSLFDEGSLNSVLSVGYNNMTRSHLDAEIAVTRGVSDRLGASTSGLLNRVGAAYGWDSLRAISVTGSDPIFAGGEFRGVQSFSLDDLYFRGFSNDHNDLEHLVNSTYSFANETVLDPTKPKQGDFVKNLETVINTTDTVQDAVKSMPLNNVYPSTQFGRALRSAEIAFLAPQMNSQVVYMRNIGFDTHSNQKTTLDRMLLELNDALTIFVNKMKTTGMWSKLVVMVFSEFGRTNKENGSLGTDHGGANPVFLMGGRVAGGSIFGDITADHLTSNGWLLPQYNLAEVYRRLLMRMDIDADRIIPVTEGPALTGLFT